MNLHRDLSRLRFCILVSAAVLAVLGPSIAEAQDPLAEDAAQALELFNAGSYKEAAEAYEKILKVPNTPLAVEAQFRLGYIYYLLGDYDKSVEFLRKILAVKPPPPADVTELAQALLPQALAAQGAKLPPTDINRTAIFQEAIEQFDAYLLRYPTGDEAEAAGYGRALAAFQIAKYEEATATLRVNLTKFPRSETILDSQYLLALALGAHASSAVQKTKAGAPPPPVAPLYDEAEKLLRDIVQKRSDVALVNDATFQVGEVLVARAASVATDKAAAAALLKRAIDAYRVVEPQEPMIKAQEERLASIIPRMREAGAAKNAVAFKRLQRLQQREQSKAMALKTKPDQTISAKIKIAQIYLQQQRYDEARVLLNYARQFTDDPEQKKMLLYYITLSYASQNIVEKAVAGYDEFQAAFKSDPVAENLPIVVGAMFLSPNPKVNDPTRAIEYFKEAIQLYPKGQFTAEALTRQADALVQLKRFDEALKTYQSFLATNPARELAASAELGIATIHNSTNKLDEASAAFRAVREKYADTPQGEQAAFWVGQVAAQKGDQKGAVAEFTSFVSRFPKSELMPNAMFSLAQAQAALGNKEAAIKLFKELAEQFPASEAAPFAFFQRATLHAAEQDVVQMTAVMREFIEKYPDSDKVYFAYDSIAQTQTNAADVEGAVATYAEMVEKQPDHSDAPKALLKVSNLWRGYAERQGRYMALNEEQRAEWSKGVTNSMAAAERLVQHYSASAEVALALQDILACQRLLVAGKLKTDAEVDTYFEDFAKRFDATPATKSKILFTLAAFTYERDKTKALEQMRAAYDPSLVYAPADIDLYGSALLAQDKSAEAKKVFAKLAADYPNPPGVAPEKAPRDVMEAQAVALYGIGKCEQKEGKFAEAGKSFDQLKKLYPWSPKILEANFGIAQSLYEQKKGAEAMALLVQIIRAPSATAELRANSMLLGGKIQEEKGEIEPAIDYYIKIATFYEGVPSAAAEGLWRGAQLLEKQAAGLTDAAKKKTQLAKAAKSYKDLADKYGASPFAEKAKARVTAPPASK